METDGQDSPLFTLIAPLSGPLLPIEQVPDPVFAQKMVGDGVSIDPTDQMLLAPCSGRVLHIHHAGHAVTVVTPEGVKVLMHLGLDTVSLKGKGFTPRVKTGQDVTTGDPLIEFDADFLARNARSLLTQIVIANGDSVEDLTACSGMVRAGVDPIMTCRVVPGDAAASPDSAWLRSREIRIPNLTGLHARPAAVLANMAKRFKAELLLAKGAQKANAKSVVAIMTLEVGQGDMVFLEARGDDGESAIETLLELIRQGLGDEGCTPLSAPASILNSPDNLPAPLKSLDSDLLQGVAASPGLAAGVTFRLKHAEITVDDSDADDFQEETRRLDNALAEAHSQLDALRAGFHSQRAADKAAIFAAHQELLGDPDLLEIARSAIDKGKRADFAWHWAYTSHAARLAALRNELLAARANDLADVGRRVLALLTGSQPEMIKPPEGCILLAEELSPSEAASFDRTRVLGFCTTLGGATSHIAIIARSLEIPAVVAMDPRILELPDSSPAVLDGHTGTLHLNPSCETLDSIRMQQENATARRQQELSAACSPATTVDGHTVELLANIGSLKEANGVISAGGEGVGLLRSEFLFMDRTTPPGEDEQFEVYRSIAASLDGRPLIIRTLDVGGDKPLPYLPIPREENPFLGERGIRVGLERPEILRKQLRAILRASAYGRIKLMFPMVALLSELRDARAILEEERGRLGAGKVEVGIMVEVPSAALMSASFANESDFFSIGTNDLTQYTLAMDRGHTRFASRLDGLNPAVLRLIDLTVQAAHAAGKPVGVCGTMASDTAAVPVLLGLGIDELSVTPQAIPGIKALIRGLSMNDCRELAMKALELDDAASVRSMRDSGRHCRGIRVL